MATELWKLLNHKLSNQPGKREQRLGTLHAQPLVVCLQLQ